MELPLLRAMNRLPNWVQRLVSIGRVPADSEEARLRKSILVLSALLMGCLSSIWVVTYALLGLWESAAIPFFYQLASAASILFFARTHRFIVFRRSQLFMSLIFPFLLQWSLGGFENGSVVCLWAITSPLGALLFVGARQSVPWFAGFVGLVGLSTAIDSSVAASAPEIPQAALVVFFALNLLGVATTTYALLQYFVRARERAAAELAREHLALELEQEKSERLLLNVLPEPVANRLKESEEVIADEFSEVTVLFADLVGFTELAERTPADQLVALLDRIFARWDVLAVERGVEKIKTIGDAYMAAAGVPVLRDDHAEAVASLALAMGPEVESCADDLGRGLTVRIGIDSGPVVAGVIGKSKFIYDLWGDTVNTASRMESHGIPGAIQVTQRVRDRLEGRFELRRRGVIDVKGKGRMESYLLVGER